jgi:hypothetical protein
MSEGDILPDISVELDEDLSVGQNAIQNAISAVQSEVGNAMQAVQATMSMQKRMFVQKQTDDTAIGEITFTKGIKLGNGGKVEITEDSAKLYIDFLEVRKKATFTSLEIQEKTHVGGQMIISPASMTCKRVEEIQDSNGDVLSYRCYMQTEGDGGEEVANQFIVGDQAICQTFNSLGCKYYWRLVTAVGKDYIELSATDCDTDSGTPAENDKIIQLGHRTNPERQAAQVLSAYGDNAPAFIMYNGINSFSLTDKEVTGVLWNPSKKEPQMFSYGDFFFGDGSTDDEENLTGQFITYQKKKGDTKKKLHINADVTLGEDSTGLSNLSEWKLQDEKVAQAANDASEAKRIAKESAKKIEDIIADGTISDLEKQALQNELAMIEGDHAEISNNYNIYLDEFENLILDGLDGFVTSDEEEFTSPRSDVKWNIYESSYNAYKKDLEDNIAVEDGTPVGNLSQSQANYYTNRIALLEEISQKINTNDKYTQESALQAKKGVTDFEYLKGAFGDAKSMAIQGVIMSQMVAVADVEEGENITKADVKAFLNGSDFADDELHGKLILAGGIPEATSEDVEDLEVRAKEASTRIYEDGHIETNDIKAVGGEFNDVKINGSIGSPFVLWRKFDITDSSSGKVYHRYPAGDSNNRYAWIHYNSNGSTLLRYTKVETPNDGSALYSSSTGSQIATAINCTPINVFDGNASIKTKHDNIVLPKTTASSSSSESDVSGYEINAEDFSWGAENSGRIIRLNNYKWGSTIAYGRTIIKAPSGKYFYENGRQHSQLMISRECIELLGYGTSSVFYGWIVLSRQNVLTIGYYGMPLNVLFQGIFIPQAPYLERLWSAELMTTGIEETWNIKILSTSGKYRIYLPMYFTKVSDFHVMLTSQITTLSGGAISGAPSDNVFACICGKGSESVNGKTCSYFDVAIGDDDTLNPGGFLFQVISTADWVSPTAAAEAVSAIDDDLGDVPVKSGNYEIYNPGVIVNVIPNE